MSVATTLPTFRKLRYTPLIDVLRGRLTGRLDLKGAVRASGLPQVIQDKVQRVARRTRLWRSEKVEVAEELLAHFADGIDSGETPDRLIEQFGDDRAAAQLIRRAKRRGRPLSWHAFRAISWGIAAVLALYLVAGLRLVIAKPAPNINYVEQMNRPLAAVPESDRAWPVYRKAVLTTRESLEQSHLDLQSSTASDQWPAVREWLLAHAGALAQARAAAARPVLGFVLGGKGSMEDPELFPNLHAAPEDGSPAGPLVCSVLLPHLNDLRMLALALAADSRLAREQGDLARSEADVVAIVHMADQVRASGGFVITDFVALGLRTLAIDEIESTLLDGRADAAALQRLSHLLVRPARASDAIALSGDRDVLQDAFQRMYTDDGSGDGHMTWRGMTLASNLFPLDDQRQWRLLAVQAPLTTASRKEVLRELNDYFATCESLLAQPLRTADWSRAEAQVARWKSDVPRYWPIAYIAPTFANAHRTAEAYLGRRDGVLIALALEAYRLRTGHYPETLAALAPDYFSAVPVDRITGGPLHYRLVEGKPLVYSVGADGDDDGGRVPVKPSGQREPNLAARWHQKPADAADGDWLLFPSYRESQQTLPAK